MSDFINKLISIRHQLHAYAENSGQERSTSAFLANQLYALEPDELLTEVGGTGLVATFEGQREGPELLFRAELDALPIPETITPEYASLNEGVSHKCGHDGHMSVLLGLAYRLADARPQKGKVHLLFQPAEETGQGAQWMIDDPKFKALQPDFVFAFHNLPGHPQGSVIVKDDVFAAASTGYIVRLKGQTSHAGHPEDGNSPAPAISSLMNAFETLPSRCAGLNRAALVTVIHARLGSPAFGTTPGEGEVMATLRSHRDEDLNHMLRQAEQITKGAASAWNLKAETETVEAFKAVTNHQEATELVRAVSQSCEYEIIEKQQPFPWSEDFGRFTDLFEKGVLFGIGAGQEHPQLHHRSYDFPDSIISVGVQLFSGIIDKKLNQD